MRRANQLAVSPEFYHTLTNNCTTNIVSHVNKLQPQRVPFGWQVLLSGNSAKYAYDLGLLDNRLPFEELRELARVNELAQENFDAADFSRRIRARHAEIAAELEATQSERYQSELSGEPAGELDELERPVGTSGVPRGLPASREPMFRPGLSEGIGGRMSDRPGGTAVNQPVAVKRGPVRTGARVAARTMLGKPETPVEALLQVALPGPAQLRAIRAGVGLAERVGDLREARSSRESGLEAGQTDLRAAGSMDDGARGVLRR
jgi:hypothetical protein